jgi:hypothetical protein
MRVDWLEFVLRVHEFPGLNLGQKLANVTEEFVFTLISPKCPALLWVPHSLLFTGYRVSFSGMKGPERSDVSPPFNAEAKGDGSMPLLHAFMT